MDARPKRLLRQREIAPLILNGQGVSLRVEGGSLRIQNGFTHYPQRRETYRFFPGDKTLPTRIIMLDGSGSLSFDALSWLAEQGVSLIRIGWRGDVVSVVGGSGYGANPDKVRWQEETRADPSRRLAFGGDLIRRKLVESRSVLADLAPASSVKDLAVERAFQGLKRLNVAPPSDIKALLGLEADCAARYFAAWRCVPLRWKAATRHPIPDHWRTVGARSTGRKGTQATNRRASHPVQAMLNYAYAVLQSRTHIQAVADGYDPTIGIMHNGYHASPAFVFDLMEPDRPKVDRAVLGFAMSETFSGADFTMREDGVCRVGPQLARRVCGLVAAV